MTELPKPKNFTSVIDYKREVYNCIESGVPTWLFDLKLEIKYKLEHEKPLEEYEKKFLPEERIREHESRIEKNA